MDNLTADQRRQTMRRVRSADTGPEMAVRRLVHALGFRFRLHRRDLPGTPDLVFPALKKALFVHGCFWHGHTCRAGRNVPDSNREYWDAKLGRNKTRDRSNRALLKRDGWSVLVLWECQLKDTASLAGRITKFLRDIPGIPQR